MRQVWNEMEMQVYHLQPGDGTRYIFGLVDLGRFHGSPTDFFPGADRSYVVIVPFTPQGRPYPFDKHALVSPYGALTRYAAEKMELHRHTCAAVILAAGWLLQHPRDVETAAHRMRLASQLLNGDDLTVGLQNAAKALKKKLEVAHATL